MLKAKNVTKKFGELVAVNNLSFEVKKGQVYGIAGPNGAGKSTVYNLITGNYSYVARSNLTGKTSPVSPPTALQKQALHAPFRYLKHFQALPYKKASVSGAASVPGAGWI